MRRHGRTHPNHPTMFDWDSEWENGDSIRYGTSRCWNTNSPRILAEPRRKKADTSVSETASIVGRPAAVTSAAKSSSATAIAARASCAAARAASVAAASCAAAIMGATSPIAVFKAEPTARF